MHPDTRKYDSTDYSASSSSGPNLSSSSSAPFQPYGRLEEEEEKKVDDERSETLPKAVVNRKNSTHDNVARLKIKKSIRDLNISDNLKKIESDISKDKKRERLFVIGCTNLLSLFGGIMLCDIIFGRTSGIEVCENAGNEFINGVNSSNGCFYNSSNYNTTNSLLSDCVNETRHSSVNIIPIIFFLALFAYTGILSVRTLFKKEQKRDEQRATLFQNYCENVYKKGAGVPNNLVTESDNYEDMEMGSRTADLIRSPFELD